jgi:hypothetical protein
MGPTGRLSGKAVSARAFERITKRKPKSEPRRSPLTRAGRKSWFMIGRVGFATATRSEEKIPSRRATGSTEARVDGESLDTPFRETTNMPLPVARVEVDLGHCDLLAKGPRFDLSPLVRLRSISVLPLVCFGLERAGRFVGRQTSCWATTLIVLILLRVL